MIDGSNRSPHLFQFDALVTSVLSAPVLECLGDLGCSSLTLQTGACAEVRLPDIKEVEDIDIQTYQYKPSLQQVHSECN